MDSEEFVRALKQNCCDVAVDDCTSILQNPPGRKPDQALVALSEWFKKLSASDRALVIESMRMAADATLFGVLCVIDGVRPCESSPEKSQFTIYANKSGEQTKVAPASHFLHDILRSEP